MSPKFVTIVIIIIILFRSPSLLNVLRLALLAMLEPMRHKMQICMIECPISSLSKKICAGLLLFFPESSAQERNGFNAGSESTLFFEMNIGAFYFINPLERHKSCKGRHSIAVLPFSGGRLFLGHMKWHHVFVVITSRLSHNTTLSSFTTDRRLMRSVPEHQISTTERSGLVPLAGSFRCCLGVSNDSLFCFLPVAVLFFAGGAHIHCWRAWLIKRCITRLSAFFLPFNR